MRLMDYLPRNYAASRETVAFQEAFQPEIDLVWRAREDFFAQLDPNTATWGLALWEEALGLTGGDALTAAQRRGRIVGRLRGMGTTTLSALRAVMDAFCPGCEVSITEHFSAYRVELHAALTQRAIDDPKGLAAALDLIMPAHLAWVVVITLESEGAAGLCAFTEATVCTEVWPRLAREVEGTWMAAVSAPVTCLPVLEIFPQGGMLND